MNYAITDDPLEVLDSTVQQYAIGTYRVVDLMKIADEFSVEYLASKGLTPLNDSTVKQVVSSQVNHDLYHVSFMMRGDFYGDNDDWMTRFFAVNPEHPLPVHGTLIIDTDIVTVWFSSQMLEFDDLTSQLERRSLANTQASARKPMSKKRRQRDSRAKR